MKKNKFMKLASGLLVLCLMTTCVIGATLAKYTTAKDVQDSARVAKWGVRISAVADSAFETTYAADDGALGGGGALSVKSSAADNVVAPGTSGTMAAFTITGQPEVAVRVKFEGTLDLGDKWVVSGSYYCPLEITVGGELFKGTNYSSADEFETAVNEKIAGFTADYDAGTDLNGINGHDLTISWKWAFDENDDEKDTFLGNQAGSAENVAKISFTVKVTVTQID